MSIFLSTNYGGSGFMSNQSLEFNDELSCTAFKCFFIFSQVNSAVVVLASSCFSFDKLAFLSTL